MKAIIAGSRILGWKQVEFAMSLCPWANEITEVICGCAPGVDRCGLTWARLEQRRVAFFPAWPDQYQWASVNRQGLEIIHYPEQGYQRGAGCGYVRNEVMGEYGEALILVWNGESKGSAHMLKTATRKELRIFENITPSR